MCDPLQILTPDTWPGLLSLYHGDSNYTARVTIKAQIYNLQKHPNFPVKAYAPYGQPKEGIIFIWRLTEIGYEISVFSNNDDKTKLTTALKNTIVIDWSSRLLLCSMMQDVRIMMRTIIQDKGYSYTDDDSYLAKLPREKALEYNSELPQDVKLEVLGAEYAEDINNEWPHRYPGSLKYFQGMLERGSALGIFGKDDNDIRGWILRSVRGDLHALHIKQEHRRKGYAQLLVLSLSKTIAERDSDIFGCIITHNTASKELFKRLGFDMVVIVNWMDCYLEK